MTDREFDELLKKAFDRYAKETLAQIPDIPDFSQGYSHGDLNMDEGYARLMARIQRGEQPADPLPDDGDPRAQADYTGLRRPDAPRKSTEHRLRRRGRALVLLSAACLALLTLSTVLALRIAVQPPVPISGAPADTLSPNQPNQPDSSGDSTLDMSGAANVSAAPSAPQSTSQPDKPLRPDESDESDDSMGYEQFILSYFHTSGSMNNAGDSGDFADPELVRTKLPLLTPDSTKENRAFDKRTGGSSIVFWSGEVQVFLSYDRPVLPVAVTYCFDNPDLLPRSCVLMGRKGSEWVELQSYTCKVSRSGVSVSFYLDARSEDSVSARYTDFCLSYHYIAMPDENYQVPKAALYGFAGEPEAFSFARYRVSGGELYSLSTNLDELTIPDSFAGVPLHTVRRGAILGTLAPNLTRLSIPEGVKTMEMSAFLGCSKLEKVCLPTSFALPVDIGSNRGTQAELYAEEIRQNADLDGDGSVGAPLSTLFEDCPALTTVEMAAGK